ncbi:MAG TPA: lipase family protein [Pirellulaceae bacterium]|nr:lipase family protein [Pirellulaceae bacterium]
MALILQTNQHYLRNAQTLGHLAIAAYAPKPAEDAAFKKTMFTEATSFVHGPTSSLGYWTVSDDHVVLAFAGTNDIRDWLTNIHFAMVPELGGKAHRGFSQALDAIWSIFFTKIKLHTDAGRKLWITGHSLGGALATLAARRLPTSMKPAGVYTFGQPRVGDTTYAKKYKLKHHRFVHNKDIVPTVPSRFIPGAFPPAFYTHVGSLEFFDKNKKLVGSSSDELGLMPELQEALSQLSTTTTEAQAKELILDGIRDHSMKAYLECLAKNVP